MGYDAGYSTDPTLPALFRMQLAQCQLDNYVPGDATLIAGVLPHTDTTWLIPRR